MATDQQTAPRPPAPGTMPAPTLPDPTAPYTLVVETGRHAGAVERLQPGRYRVGSTLDADLMLSDDGVAPSHVLIELSGHSVRVEPLSAAIGVGDARLQPGQFARTRLPCTLAVGEARLALRRPRERRDGPSPRSIGLLAGGVAVALAVAVLSSSPSERPIAEATASARAPSTVADLDASRASEVVTAAGTSTTAASEEPHAALRRRLQATGLGDLEITGEGERLVVSGAIPPEAMARWRETQMWFDQTFGNAAVLASRVRPAKQPERPEISIEAVYAGDDAYLVAGGERYPVGATIARRWQVAAIAADRVLLQGPSGESAVIELAAPSVDPAAGRPR